MTYLGQLFNRDSEAQRPNVSSSQSRQFVPIAFTEFFVIVFNAIATFGHTLHGRWPKVDDLHLNTSQAQSGWYSGQTMWGWAGMSMRRRWCGWLMVDGS